MTDRTGSEERLAALGGTATVVPTLPPRGGCPAVRMQGCPVFGRLPARKIGQHWPFVSAEIERVLSDRDVI